MPPTDYTDDDLVDDESHQRVSSYFLGPKAENHEWFKGMLGEILDAQRDARLDYFPRDQQQISELIQTSGAFRSSHRKMRNAIRIASHLLAKYSIPFWSPRYQGHMCMEMAMPALLGYFMTMIYNPNNVSIEASPITTVAEIQVGVDLCRMFGFNVDPLAGRVGWGHVTCDGTVANLESMWTARNLKFYPLTVASAMKDGGPLAYIRDSFLMPLCDTRQPKKLFEMGTWELLNLWPEDILDIPERLYKQYYISPAFLNDVIKTYGVQSVGKDRLEKEFGIPIKQEPEFNSKYFLSNTKHYSWPKAAAITGIGASNVVGLNIDPSARVLVSDLKDRLQYCLDNSVAVYGVVAIMGSTEEGAVDPLNQILALRDDFRQKGLSFVIHADGAWGGYFCTMIPEGYEPGQDLAPPEEKGATEGFVPDATLKPSTADDLWAIRHVDSVTVDPHKAAYVPYPAGGLCYRDGRMRYLTTWTSPYIARGEILDTTIGVFGVEGSKPGASVMATHMANACIGLNPQGYGKLLGEVTFTCNRLAAEWATMSTDKDPFVVVPLNQLPSEKVPKPNSVDIEAERQRIRDKVISKTNLQIVQDDATIEDPKQKTITLLRDLGSDLNINGFSANWRYEPEDDKPGRLNDDVEEANYFNQLVIQELSVDSPNDEPGKIPFYLSSTTFMYHEYKDCVQTFKQRLGLPQDETDLVVMRNVVMSPWPTDGGFIHKISGEYRKALERNVVKCRARNDDSPDNHSFLLQGTDPIFAVHFTMFNLEKHRRQLIWEVKLDDATKTKYNELKTEDPEATFILKSSTKISLDLLVDKSDGFKAVVAKRLPKEVSAAVREWEYVEVIPEFDVNITRVVKFKNLRSPYRDPAYPSRFFPFYLYGTKDKLIIEHILVRSPNIQLSAEGITLEQSLLDAISNEQLEKGCLLLIDNLSEAAMQPFQSTEGVLRDTLDPSAENFFFTPANTFETVHVYVDPFDARQSGPRLLDIYGEYEDETEPARLMHGHKHQPRIRKPLAHGDSAAGPNGGNAGSITAASVNFGLNGYTNGATNGDTGDKPVADDPNLATNPIFTFIGKGKMTLSKTLYIDSKRINEDPFFIPDGNDKYKAWKDIFDLIGKELG